MYEKIKLSEKYFDTSQTFVVLNMSEMAFMIIKPGFHLFIFNFEFNIYYIYILYCIFVIY